MAVESKVLPVGSKCPSFSLPSVDQKHYGLEDFSKSTGLLVAFICNHCPYVKAIEDRLIAISRAFPVSDLQVVGICSNDPVGYPEDAPEELYARWKQKNYGFPYLIDSTQKAAVDFGAACTPDLFLYDQQRRLYYHGRIDDSWKDPARVTKEELKAAVKSLLVGAPAPVLQINTIGCSIKWKN